MIIIDLTKLETEKESQEKSGEKKENETKISK